MKLPRIEQETIILYNEAEATAEVFTYDQKLLTKLERLAVKYPDQITRTGERQYIVPKACVLVRELFSEERRKAASDRAKANGYRPPASTKAKPMP